jgi:hypothetical protein
MEPRKQGCGAAALGCRVPAEGGWPTLSLGGPGNHAVVVDALGADARAFSERFGFSALTDDEMRLFLPVSTIRAAAIRITRVATRRLAPIPVDVELTNRSGRFQAGRSGRAGRPGGREETTPIPRP